jgi:hypothetical protein
MVGPLLCTIQLSKCVTEQAQTVGKGRMKGQRSVVGEEEETIVQTEKRNVAVAVAGPGDHQERQEIGQHPCAQAQQAPVSGNRTRRTHPVLHPWLEFKPLSHLPMKLYRRPFLVILAVSRDCLPPSLSSNATNMIERLCYSAPWSVTAPAPTSAI